MFYGEAMGRSSGVMDQIDKTPLLIAVAPNGARHARKDHPALPLSPRELAQTAVECRDAGAAMMHLHVRDKRGLHSLDPDTYRKTLKEVHSAVGETMLIQVSSEAAGVYRPQQQMAAMLALETGCISVGLREIIKDRAAVDAGAKFLAELKLRGTLAQYILYSPDDIVWYQKLCQDGVIPSNRNLVLVVIGRYRQQRYAADLLQSYLAVLRPSDPWMVCAFGNQEREIMRQAIKLGGHCRVGFENNLCLADGSLAPSNAVLVNGIAGIANDQGRRLADALQAVELFAAG